jgi:hypothetical protein
MSESHTDNTQVNADTTVGRMNAGQNDPNNNDQMKKALDILTGRDSQDTDLDEGDVGEADEGNKSNKRTKPLKTIQDAAERLGVSIDDIYKLQLAIEKDGDAEQATLGALKDHFKDRNEFQLERIRLGEERAQQEGDLMRTRNELAELMALLPKESLKPEVVKAIREKHTAHQNIERERIFQVIPEWKNETKRDADLAAMREHLDRSGFPTGYLNNVADHKTFRYIRENMLREQRILQALALVKPKAPKGKQAPSNSGPTTRGPSRQTSDKRGTTAEGQQVAAVKNLLRGLIPNT